MSQRYFTPFCRYPEGIVIVLALPRDRSIVVDNVSAFRRETSISRARKLSRSEPLHCIVGVVVLIVYPVSVEVPGEIGVGSGGMLPVVKYSELLSPLTPELSVACMSQRYFTPFCRYPEGIVIVLALPEIEALS